MSDAVTHIDGAPATPPRIGLDAPAAGAALSRAARRRRRLEDYRTGVTAAQLLLLSTAGGSATG